MLFIKEKSHTLTVAELPAHSHGRGTQDIQGGMRIIGDVGSDDGAISIWSDNSTVAGGGIFDYSGSGGWGRVALMNFYASRKWSGTSESIGSGSSIDIMNPYKVAYCFMRVS